MVEATYRIEHYWAKIEPILESLGLGSYIPMIKSQFEASVEEAVKAETAAKSVATAAGISTAKLGSYTSFAKEVGGIKAKHSGAIAQQEIDIAKAKWEARGLTGAQLDKIINLL